MSVLKEPYAPDSGSVLGQCQKEISIYLVADEGVCPRPLVPGRPGEELGVARPSLVVPVEVGGQGLEQETM